jgi:hypothetical protein
MRGSERIGAGLFKLAPAVIAKLKEIIGELVKELSGPRTD